MTIAPSLTARAEPPATPFSTSSPTLLTPLIVMTPVALLVAFTAPATPLPSTEIAALRRTGVVKPDASSVIAPLLTAVPPSPPIVMPVAFCASDPTRIVPLFTRTPPPEREVMPDAKLIDSTSVTAVRSAAFSAKLVPTRMVPPAALVAVPPASATSPAAPPYEPVLLAATLAPPPIRIAPVLLAIAPVPTTTPALALPISGLSGASAMSRLATLMMPAFDTAAPFRASTATLLVVAPLPSRPVGVSAPPERTSVSYPMPITPVAVLASVVPAPSKRIAAPAPACARLPFATIVAPFSPRISVLPPSVFLSISAMPTSCESAVVVKLEPFTRANSRSLVVRGARNRGISSCRTTTVRSAIGAAAWISSS